MLHTSMRNLRRARNQLQFMIVIEWADFQARVLIDFELCKYNTHQTIDHHIFSAHIGGLMPFKELEVDELNDL